MTDEELVLAFLNFDQEGADLKAMLNPIELQCSMQGTAAMCSTPDCQLDPRWLADVVERIR